jgi:hypothetical protein
MKNRNKGPTNIIYISNTIYVDHQTGEILTKQIVKKYYKIINKYEYATSQYFGRFTKKYITITNECERTTHQGELFE